MSILFIYMPKIWSTFYFQRYIHFVLRFNLINNNAIYYYDTFLRMKGKNTSMHITLCVVCYHSIKFDTLQLLYFRTHHVSVT